MRHHYSILTDLGGMLAKPAAVLVVLAYTVLWAVFDRESLDWEGVATLATVVMALLIVRTQYRDTLALHAKLDELLRVNAHAKDELTSLDDKEPEEIETIRDSEKADADSDGLRVLPGHP